MVNNNAQELAGLLGLTDYEARAYLGLLREGPLTGYAVAKASGIPTSKSYEAVDGLARKGGATLLPGDPPRHAAVPPDALIAHARHRHAQALDALNAALSDAAQAAPGSDVPPLWRAGMDAGLAQTAARIGTATRTIVGALPLAARDALEPAFSEAAGRGVLVQSVGSGDTHLTLLLDDREAILASFSPPAEFIGTGSSALLSLCRARLRDASVSPFLRPPDEASEWLRWEEQKGRRLLSTGHR